MNGPRAMLQRALAIGALLLVAIGGPLAAAPAQAAAPVPAFDHIVVVVEENHSYDQVRDQPYLSHLMARGANFTRARAETHPSQPNYLHLWSGSSHGVSNDDCTTLHGNNLGAQAIAAGISVAGYSESLPGAGSTACTSGPYAKKHNPIATFAQTSGSRHNLPFSSFPSDYSALPRLALVVPNLDHDMHDGSVRTGDDWLRQNLGGYADWATSHNSLLIVTFDEDDKASNNSILNVLVGAHVVPGSYGRPVSHWNDLTTVEAALGLPRLHGAAPIVDVWKSGRAANAPGPAVTPPPRHVHRSAPPAPSAAPSLRARAAPSPAPEPAPAPPAEACWSFFAAWAFTGTPPMVFLDSYGCTSAPAPGQTR
jgi:hypothetical protein